MWLALDLQVQVLSTVLFTLSLTVALVPLSRSSSGVRATVYTGTGILTQPDRVVCTSSLTLVLVVSNASARETVSQSTCLETVVPLLCTLTQLVYSRTLSLSSTLTKVLERE
jgi:hypothetical protein